MIGLRTTAFSAVLLVTIPIYWTHSTVNVTPVADIPSHTPCAFMLTSAR